MKKKFVRSTLNYTLDNGLTPEIYCYDPTPGTLEVAEFVRGQAGAKRVRDVLPEEAESLLERRVAFVNLWKPIHRRVEGLSLGVCDATSTVREDRLRLDTPTRESIEVRTIAFF